MNLEESWVKIVNHCKKKNNFFSTPQNLSDLHFLNKFNVPAIKVIQMILILINR